jgi:hypothetical protein
VDLGEYPLDHCWDVAVTAVPIDETRPIENRPAGINSASPERAVQLPIELAPAMQRLLMDWCRDTAHRLQVRGIARGDVIEALLEHLVSDERAASAVRERLARQLAT